VTALAYKLARLIGPLHVKFSAGRAALERALELAPKSTMKTRNTRRIGTRFARLIREAGKPVNATGGPGGGLFPAPIEGGRAKVKNPHNTVR